MKIRTLANTFLIRSSAQRFANGAHELRMKAQKIDTTRQSLTEGTLAWHGTAASAYSAQSIEMGVDIRTSADAFEKVAQVLYTLAGELDEVNSLRQQVEQLRGEIRALEGELWEADDYRRSSIHQEISSLSYRASSLESQADSLEYRANAAASSSFDEIAAMANRLHSYNSEDPWWKQYAKPSKGIEITEAALDTTESIQRYKKGFGVKVGRNNLGKYAQVSRGEVEKIRGTRYYFSNAEQYEQVMKYVDGKVAALEDIKEIKSLGYLGTGASVVEDFIDDSTSGADASKYAADATVDVGLGVASTAVSAWAGAQTGAEIGAWIGTAAAGPVGTLVGGLVGVGVGLLISYTTEHIDIGDGSISDHMKDSLKKAIDGGTSLAKSAAGSICSLFD